MGSRFVILRHDVNGRVHFDLMLEIAGQENLRTWQLSRWPLAVGEPCACKQIGDHRRAYLDYEGEVSGGRGTVKRVQAGTWADEDGAIVLSTGETLRIDGAELRRIR